MNERLVRQDIGARHDAERDRKNQVVLGMIFDEAAEGRLYTATQFAEAFENQHDLGGRYSIRERLSVLATKGLIKFRRSFTEHGYAATQSHFGYLVIRDMRFGRDPVIDTDTGEVLAEGVAVLPTHYKCPHSGRAREVENPSVWVYPEEAHD